MKNARSAMSLEGKILVFPSYLRDESYKNRCVTFQALESIIFSTLETDIALEKNSESLDPLNMAGSIGKGIAKTAIGNFGLTKLGGRATIEGSVTLPFPNSLSDSQQHTWNAEDGLMGTITGDISNMIAKKADGVFGKGNGKNAIEHMMKYYRSASNAMGVRKLMRDPGTFQNYTGTAPRNFVLAYNFVPMNQQEAKTIKDIITWFKYFSSPTYGGTLALLSPHVFNINFAGNEYISQMFNMQACVLTAINVDYGADGAFSLFQDGFPKQINLTLSFAENRITYAQEYEDQM